MHVDLQNIFSNGNLVEIGHNGLHHTNWLPWLFEFYGFDCYEQRVVLDHLTGIQSHVGNWLDDIDMRLYINGFARERFTLVNQTRIVSGGYGEESFNARIVVDLSPSSSRWVEISYFNPEDEETLYGSIQIEPEKISLYLADSCLECELSSIFHIIMTDSAFGGIQRYLEIK